ncbi:cell division protein ZapE [Streptomyces sp. AJS327]|uniref:cell division protein ZapE n=1 Tax=Streptomyces sp. AJS327 TaxID=2545265 RepID=UPI0015DDDBF8|nr:cell division protein ZapE [Streptomyces sp. AJS327]MBA0052612.1 cell division protein ZapE [Streptomyces sp. AJS327]
MEKVELAATQAGFTLDPAQRTAAGRLARLDAELTRKRRLFGANPPPRGVYLWGPVGRGKSWLATAFFEAVDVRQKRRVHFHEFFREFHAAYARHRADRRACELAVAELLDGCRFLCFDEFHVHDPGDAMMMGRVLTSLFEQNITLLTTSNYPPAGLMPNPVYHHMVEPLITLLESSMDTVEVAGPTDYRAESRPTEARTEFQRGGYLWPGTARQLTAAGLVRPGPDERCGVETGGRELPALAVREAQVWFDFAELCDAATSTIDYLSLADRFDHWVLSGLPRMTGGSRDAAQRFANLVDVLCDRDARFHLIGEAPLEECLRGEALPIDINRTASRLRLLPVLAAPEDVGAAAADA